MKTPAGKPWEFVDRSTSLAWPWKIIYSSSTKTWNLESGNRNGITEMETEMETEYRICERKFQVIELKRKILAMTIK